jgi:glutamyl-tRNA synthetase
MRQNGYDSLAILQFLAQVGTSLPIVANSSIDSLINNFSFANFSKSSTNYDLAELTSFNQKILQTLSFDIVQSKLQALDIYNINQQIWQACQKNITFLPQISEWQQIFQQDFFYSQPQQQEFLKQCSELLPQDTSQPNSWQTWLDSIKSATGKQGKEIFLPIRLALTGKEHGPELKHIINLIPRAKIITRLQYN